MIQFPNLETYLPLIQLARAEDLGPRLEDATSNLCIPESLIGVATLLQQQPGIVCGLPMVEHICRIYDERLRVEMIPGFHMEIIEGRFSDQKITPLLRIRGPMRSLLSAERVILNFLQHLSGVATLTNRFVKRVEGTSARIVDTRKTLPGFRSLDKYAVAVGGGENHRYGLYDMILIKDNHLVQFSLHHLAESLVEIVRKSRSERPSQKIEVEVDNLEQLKEVLKVEGIDYILLDNMDCPTMIQAVEMRNACSGKGRVLLEASGGVTLETVRSIALTGVDRISVGAITHSAPALDIGMDIEPQ
ncbi:MAG: nicotinate-nucleotide diphosphorylase (carboxylating) [Phycisphaerae bacterium]|jgi:nicotinate-nucleotide pyrophosphorylase (carboxylating)|nr:MAG: nicotinate-nucleotide diphosphorylase (carboxylating) [Phycisphaerae bacterium]